jgi:two-component system OmpR family response regulator
MDDIFNTQDATEDVPLQSAVEDAGERTASTDAKHVILVEDDDFLRGLLSHNMNDAGFKVRPAPDAETAFKFLKMQRPDIILLDLILPGMNGFDFLTEIKQKERMDFPVLVLSNLGSQEDIDMAKQLGAADFLIKANVTPGQIIAKVNSILGS